MRYLRVQNLTKSYTARPIIDDLSFSLDKGQKVALVAKNGGGKTTLLKLIMNQLDKTDGTIERRKGLKIWYLSQDFHWDLELSVLDYLFSQGDNRRQLIKQYEASLENPQSLSPDQMNDLLIQLESLQARDYESKVQTIISRLIAQSETQHPFLMRTQKSSTCKNSYRRTRDTSPWRTNQSPRPPNDWMAGELPQNSDFNSFYDYPW